MRDHQCSYLALDCAVVNLLTARAEEVGRVLTDGAPRHHGGPPAGGRAGAGRDLLAEVPGPDGQTLGRQSLLPLLARGRARDPHRDPCRDPSRDPHRDPDRDPDRPPRELEAGHTSWLGPQSLLELRTGQELLDVCAELPPRLTRLSDLTRLTRLTGRGRHHIAGRALSRGGEGRGLEPRLRVLALLQAPLALAE